MRRVGTTLRVPGFPLLINDRTGTPSSLRWLSIAVDGVVTVRTTPNRIGYSEELSRWIQWRLVRDVTNVIDPADQFTDLLVVREVIETRDDGVVVTPDLPGSADTTSWPENPVATAMLSGIGFHRPVRGTVAWLGDTDPDSGMHADLSKYRLDCLQILAAQAHANVMATMQRSAN